VSEAKQQILEAVINNPKSAGAAVGFWGAFFADTTVIQAANVYIAFIGGCLGLILTSLLIYKNFKQIKES